MELAGLWLGRSVPTALSSKGATATSRLKTWVTKTSCLFLVMLPINFFRFCALLKTLMNGACRRHVQNESRQRWL